MTGVYEDRPTEPSDDLLHRFRVTALADPGLLARALEPLAKRGLIPARVTAIREERRLPGLNGGGVADALVLSIDCAGLDVDQAAHVVRVLETTVGVVEVALERVRAAALAA